VVSLNGQWGLKIMG